MKRETVLSRSGIPTLRANDVFLHSRYDPRREAQRHLDSIDLASGRPRVVVVVGEGIPYLSEAVASRYPEISVFAAMVGPVSPNSSVPQLDLTSIESGDLRRWLRGRLSPLDVAVLQIIPWEAGRRVAPTETTRAEREILAVVQNASAEIATIGSFGRRWIANTVRLAILVDRRGAIPRVSENTTLVTSGPSLESLVMAGRTVFPGMLTATSSAWYTLSAFGANPDLIVHTDGGYWAARYLMPCFDHRCSTEPVIAISAQAAVPQVLLRPTSRQRFTFLSTGWFGERLHRDTEEWVRVPEAPSVTVTALHVLHSLNPEARIFLSGMDLMSRGLLTHARPHPNDQLIAAWAHRLRPEIAIRAERALRGPALPERWSDGRAGYRSKALEAFVPEIRRAVENHRSTGSVVSLPVGSTVSEDDRQRHGTPPLPSHLPDSGYERDALRPSRAERVAYLLKTLTDWRAAAINGRWDGDQQEILFHLAPVEVLQTLRGELDSAVAAAAAWDALDTFEDLARRISGR